MKFFWKYLFPPLYGLVIYVTIRILLDPVTGMRWWQRHWQINAEDIVSCIVFSYLFMFVFHRLLRWFDRKCFIEASRNFSRGSQWRPVSSRVMTMRIGVWNT